MTDARREGGPAARGESVDRLLAEVAALVPAPLRAFGNRLAAGPCGPGARPAATLRDRAVFDAAVDAFAAGYGACDRRAVVSYWTQFYLAALVIPGLTALAHRGRAPPLALDAVGFELDAAGRLARFLVPTEASTGSADRGRGSGLAALVEGHLRPFVELCHAHSGLARRVLWGNAAVIVERTAEALRAAGAPVPAEVDVLLGRGADGTFPDARHPGAGTGSGAEGGPDGWPCAGLDCAAGARGSRSPLARTLRAGGPGDGPCRRVCCLRYRLPGVADCGALCPARPAARRPGIARTDRPC